MYTRETSERVSISVLLTSESCIRSGSGMMQREVCSTGLGQENKLFLKEIGFEIQNNLSTQRSVSGSTGRLADHTLTPGNGINLSFIKFTQVKVDV